MPSRRPAVPLVLALVAAISLPASAQVTPGCAVDGYDDHCELWVGVEDDPDGLAPLQSPTALASSPDGKVVYASLLDSTGGGFSSRTRWVVVARDAATGATLWTYRESGTPEEYAFTTSIAVSPDGSRIFVSGSRRPENLSPDSRLVTIALDASNGSEVWTATYDGSPGIDNSRELAVAPDGSTLYVAGISGPGGNLDYAAIAYDATTGDERWVTRYEGIGRALTDSPYDIAVSDDGETLALTGHSGGPGEFDVDFATVAFETSGSNAGDIRWVARYDGVGARAPDRANAVVFSPDGSRVFVGGMSGEDRDGPPFSVDYRLTTIAYDTRTGEAVWESRRSWSGATMTEVSDMAMSPDGSLLYATGYANGGGNTDMVTIAYDSGTGQELGAAREALTEHDSERGTALVATEDAVVVTGSSSTHLTEPLFLNQRRLVDMTTTAYSPNLGAKLWTARLNATGIGQTSANDIVMAGDRVVVMGRDSDNIEMDADTADGVLAAYDLDQS